jgi:hypothetical protein
VVAATILAGCIARSPFSPCSPSGPSNPANPANPAWTGTDLLWDVVSDVNTPLLGVAAGAGKWVAGGGGGTVLTSSDLSTWTRRDLAPGVLRGLILVKPATVLR